MSCRAIANRQDDLLLFKRVSRSLIIQLSGTKPLFFDRLVTMPQWKVVTSTLLRALQPADYRNESRRQGFSARGNTKSNQNLRQQALNSPQPPMPPLNQTASFSSAYSAGSDDVYQEQPKKFLNERYAKCSVKGNFLTLAAQPKNVELGEWLAHQGMTFAFCGGGNADTYQSLK